jgi:high-affinity iron transporter
MTCGMSRLALLVSLAALLSAACAKPVEVSPERGGELYLSYGCAACHGPTGNGDGPAASLSKIPPRNLRDLASYAGGTTAEDIARSIEYGMKETGMPAYVELPLDERMSMAIWILDIAKERK